MLPEIRLMADYGCSPLWSMDGHGEIDPSTLPLSASTVAALADWATTYDGILNWSDPASTDWPSPEAEAAWTDEGHRLWGVLRAELSGAYRVHLQVDADLLRDDDESGPG